LLETFIAQDVLPAALASTGENWKIEAGITNRCVRCVIEYSMTFVDVLH